MVPGEFLITPNVIALLWPVLAYIGFVFFLYAYLTYVRKRAVKAGRVETSCFVLGREEPIEVARVTRNLGNQFELPAIYFFLILMLITLHQVAWFDIAMAWLFLIGRVIHSYVQTQTDNVALRGIIFTINFLAVIALAMHLGLALLRVPTA